MHQSLAISRFIARKVGLAGDNDLEAYEIDAVVYTLNDLRLGEFCLVSVGFVLTFWGRYCADSFRTRSNIKSTSKGKFGEWTSSTLVIQAWWVGWREQRLFCKLQGLWTIFHNLVYLREVSFSYPGLTFTFLQSPNTCHTTMAKILWKDLITC